MTEPPNQEQGEKEKEKEGNKWWQPDTRWREEDGLYVDGLQVSELPDSFDDALQVGRCGDVWMVDMVRVGCR